MLKNRIKNPIVRSIVEWLLAIALAAALFFVVRMFVFRVAHVSGSSMEPTLSHGDRVVLNRLPIRFSRPRVGDIVAFPNPVDPSEYFIKRVIAAPGDIVDLQDGVFLVNGVPLDDPFSHEVILPTPGIMDFPIIVEEGRYFVLGDNRNGSMDSRFTTVGTVPARDMVGRVAIRIWPRIGTVD